MAVENPRDLEQEIQILRQQLAEAQKMTALGQLVSTTTHEFNNVLMTIMNYAKMGLRNKDEETRSKALEKILAASQRANKITNSVLGMARNRRDSFEPIQLETIVGETLVLLEREMSKYRVSIETQIEPTPPARANGNQIQQVLLNLLVNARQAMADGGRIVVSLKHDKTAGSIDLQVRDFGCGIDPQVLPRIFDAFYSTKSGPDASGKGGCGLGLSACKDIVESHGGKIRVESSLGKGTAFTIKLPVWQSTNSLPQPATPAGQTQISMSGQTA